MCGTITRFVLVTIVAFLQIITFPVQAQQAYEVNLKQAINDKALYGQAFLNLTNTPIVECFEYCVKHCSCKAFQICQKTECRLLSSSRFLTPSSLLSMLGCIYYDMMPRKQVNPFCASVINCCMTSNPCLNGGTCLPPLPSNEKRFRCQCPDGFEGDRCEQCKKPGFKGPHQCDQPIRSCRGYGKGSRVAGNYTALDVNNNTFEVFCDFDRNSSMTWTLIQSYSQKNNNDFYRKPLFNDYTLKIKMILRGLGIVFLNPEWNPSNRTLPNGVSHVDMTLMHGVVYIDYLRASNTNLNILTDIGQQCVNVEYINVRGQNCTGCAAYLRQDPNKLLHFFSDERPQPPGNCDFKPFGEQDCKTNGKFGYYFGHYYCKNTEHRCLFSDEATTQTRIGAED